MLILQVRSLSCSQSHSLIQVILFDPQLIINKLHKMEKIESKPRPVQQPSHVRAFRTYISARRNYSLAVMGDSSGENIPPTDRRYICVMHILIRKHSNSSAIALLCTFCPSFHRVDVSPGIPRVQVKAMEAIGDAMAGGQRQEVIKPESPTMTINIARLLVSCLHAWNLDSSLDRYPMPVICCVDAFFMVVSLQEWLPWILSCPYIIIFFLKIQ